MKPQTVVIVESDNQELKNKMSQVLADKLKLPVVDISKHNDNVSDPLINLMYVDETVCQMTQQLQSSVIINTSYASEYANSRFLNRNTSHEQILSLDERFAAMNTTIVILVSDVNDTEDKVKHSQLQEWYKEFTRFTKCDTLTIGCEKDNFSADVDLVMQHLADKSNK